MTQKFMESIEEWKKGHPEKTKSIEDILKKTEEINGRDKRGFNPRKYIWKSNTGSSKDKNVF